jgi:hypothetical protein
MSGPPPEIDEADVFLAKLARLDLRAAQHVHDCLLDTTEPEEVARLAQAYARCSRQVRQTLACHAKLKHDREKAAREAARHEAELKAGRPVADEARKTPQEVAYEARADHLVEAVERVIAHVAAGDEARHTALAHRFDRELDDWYEKPDFLDLDPQAHIRHACRRLGLPEHLADTWPDLPEPTFFPDPEVRRRDPDELTFDAAPPAPDSDSAEDPPLPLSDTG